MPVGRSSAVDSQELFVIDSGRIIEEGFHTELLAQGETGAYASLVRLQQISFMA